MKALLSIILVTILQIPIISGIFHTIEDKFKFQLDQLNEETSFQDIILAVKKAHQ